MERAGRLHPLSAWMRNKINLTVGKVEKAQAGERGLHRKYWRKLEGKQVFTQGILIVMISYGPPSLHGRTGSDGALLALPAVMDFESKTWSGSSVTCLMKLILSFEDWRERE